MQLRRIWNEEVIRSPKQQVVQELVAMARETSRAPRASLWLCVAHFVLLGCCGPVLGTPKNLVVDTDIDTDDVFALLYLLKQNRSEINLKVVSPNR